MTDLGYVMRCYSVRFERSSKHSAARLWRAITDSSEVSAWMTYPARIELRVGGDYFVDFSRHDSSALDGVIVKVELERLLRYAWGTSIVDWELEDRPDGCRFVFTHWGVHDRGFADEEGLLAGWHRWLDDLELFADGGRPVPPDEDRAAWRQLGQEYRPILSKVLGGLRSETEATGGRPTDRA